MKSQQRSLSLLPQNLAGTVRAAPPPPPPLPRPTDLCMAAAASSKGRAIAGSFVTRVLAGKAAAPRYAARSPPSGLQDLVLLLARLLLVLLLARLVQDLVCDF